MSTYADAFALFVGLPLHDNILGQPTSAKCASHASIFSDLHNVYTCCYIKLTILLSTLHCASSASLEGCCLTQLSILCFMQVEAPQYLPSGDGQKQSSGHESVDNTSSKKRKAMHTNSANTLPSKQQQLSNGQAAPASVAQQPTQNHASDKHGDSEDTQSNGVAASDAVSPHDAQQPDATKDPPEMQNEDLVQNLAANLRMALKALAILKGIDASTFEKLQPTELAGLNLDTLCETPGSTP